jgi:hypothetical protein
MASLGTAHAAAGLANVASAAPTSGRTAIDGTRREPRPFKGTTFSYSQTPRPWFQARTGFHSKPTINSGLITYGVRVVTARLSGREHCARRDADLC